MGFLQRKRILITGLLSTRSIAYGIAKSAYREGAELAFTYADDRFKERVTQIAMEFESNIIFPCNVADDAQINSTFYSLYEVWPSLDGLVHSIAFASPEAISGDFLEGINRKNFCIAHEISSYSFVGLVKAARFMLSENASLLTLTYLGSERVVPNYNTMGLAKASLEASVRYMAMSLGRQGIRVNAISAGPIKTLAASGIKEFPKILDLVQRVSPLHRNVTIEQVGNVASFLLSSLSSGITAEVIHVDSGFNATCGITE